MELSGTFGGYGDYVLCGIGKETHNLSTKTPIVVVAVMYCFSLVKSSFFKCREVLPIPTKYVWRPSSLSTYTCHIIMSLFFKFAYITLV